jgi:MoaA/NifB/PqqE/SkfB family radical SAM enzyme
MQEIYSAAKIAFHPEALDKLRRAEPQAPLIIQWMPTNVCNQACEFCSYGSGPEAKRAAVVNPDKKLWKNQQLFEGRDTMSREKMLETVQSLAEMGVKCVELTGGGEPTTYPHFDELVALLAERRIEVALVTNGTLITEERADLLGSVPFTWARVSIDAGNPADYARIRNVPDSHWDKAWKGVRRLVRRRRAAGAHPESTVGVGFVIDRSNWGGLYSACELAHAHGADNVRISTSFTPDGLNRFDEECRTLVPRQIEEAKRDFEKDGFTIHDLSAERWHNTALGRQEYPFCGWKEIGAVIGADSNVYACCSWAYNEMGRMFSIAGQNFRDGWFGDGAKWREAHDPRRDCRIHCLYEKRNMEMLRLMGDREYAGALRELPPPSHANFV